MCCILLLTSAVMVAFGAKPWPGLIDSTCCPVGTLHRGSRMMEAWPGRNSIQILTKKKVFIKTAWKLYLKCCEATTAASDMLYIPKTLTKTIPVSMPAVHSGHRWFCLSSRNITVDQVSEQQPIVNCCQEMPYVPFSRSAPGVLLSALWFPGPAPFRQETTALEWEWTHATQQYLGCTKCQFVSFKASIEVSQQSFECLSSPKNFFKSSNKILNFNKVIHRIKYISLFKK